MNGRIICSLSVLLCTFNAYAQSNVTLYGVIDSGITYSNNQGGHASWQAVSGVPTGSHWGLTGREDLGGGLAAIFKLEAGFDGFSGAAFGSGFQRQAQMGLTSTKYGTLTFGRQYDFIVDYVAPFTSNGSYAGWYFSHPEDVDNTDNGFIINRSVKYVSPNYGGFQFGGMYSFGGVAGDFKRNSVWSVGGTYSVGAASFGAAYLRAANPGTGLDGFYLSTPGHINTVYGDYLAAASYQNIFGVGGSYSLGQAKVLLSYTDTTFEGGDAGRNVSFKNVEGAIGYYVTPEFYLLGSYTYTFGNNNSTGASPKYHQFNLMADYFLSKRTDVYAMAVFQQAAGDAKVAQITGFNASSTNRQLAFRVALKHSF